MLLITNGLIHTMTDKGSFRGDVLVNDGLIARVEEHIDKQPGCRIINAEGLQITPGLIDAHIQLIHTDEDEQKNLMGLCSDALSSGVTTQALWPEDGERCMIRHGVEEAMPDTQLVLLRHEAMTDVELRTAMTEARVNSVRIACRVGDSRQLRRILAMKAGTGCEMVLLHLNGCGGMVREIAASGCDVILGSGGFAMAAELSAAGVNVALTSDHPATRLHHLPLCAGLCVRAGMEHEAAMRMITAGAARILRVEKACGSIAPGLRADMTVFDGDPLLLATARVMTLSGGIVFAES